MTLRMSEEEFKAFKEKRSPAPKRKYRNEPVMVNGISIDSKKEAIRYQDLLEQQRAGQITDLARQPIIGIVVKDIHVCDYIGDFSYIRDGKFVLEDVKSKATRKIATYVLKKKLVFAVWGITISEI